MEDFILQSCEAYTSLTGKTFKEASSPYVADGNLVETDWESKGQLEGSASKVLMKRLWLARLAIPGPMKGICDLTRRVTCWSRADDKRLYRLVCYWWSTKTMLQALISPSPPQVDICALRDHPAFGHLVG